MYTDKVQFLHYKILYYNGITSTYKNIKVFDTFTEFHLYGNFTNG